MGKRLIWEVILACAVCLACGGMAAICVYLGHTLGVSAWLALGVSTALHVRNYSVCRRAAERSRLNVLEELNKLNANVADIEAAYRDALARHEREAGRALQ